MPSYELLRFSPPAPCAHVTLRNIDTGATQPDVWMLVDSGADVTLLPRSALTSIGVQFESAGGYELVGFDGKTSIAEAVHLDFLFLGRTFKGRFLVTDGEYGIIGRNILNHISLLLDGPRLVWEER